MTPSLRAIVLLALASLPVAALPFTALLAGVAFLPTVVVLAVMLADRVGGTGARLHVEREVRPVLSVGTGNPVQLAVRNASGRRFDVELADEAPEAGTVDPAPPFRVTLAPHGSARVEYAYTPARRGRQRFDGVQLRHLSRLGLWRVRRRLDVVSEIQVFPNIAALHRFELLAQHNNLAEIGVRTVRMRGDGTEFERMREYRDGDDPRAVDWKSTARLNRLIVREMGEERNQNVLFLIDAGRMMRQTTGGLSHFDYALNTAIILGHIATRRGDNVGALLFADKVLGFVPLGRGRAAVDAIVHATYDLEPAEVATNYRRAFRYVMAQVRRRALLLMMTHLVPGEDQRLIRAYGQHVGRQHLPLCLFFREPAVQSAVRAAPRTVAETFHRAAAADMVAERLEGISTLRHRGVLALDALPEEYSAAAIGQYLDIKARHLL